MATGRDPGIPELEQEARLFEEAVTDVQPLPPERQVPPARSLEPVALSERDREVMRELDALIAGELPFELRHGDELIEGAVPGLDPRVLRRLRAGEFAAQAHLDLHGLHASTARERVDGFIRSSHALGLRCVRIVHGRGLNSPGGMPVLKAGLPRWLARGAARRIVLAYTSARPCDGGVGAIYVVLRKNR